MENREGVWFRPGTPADAEAIWTIYLASRKQFLPYAPLAHSDSEILQYIATQLIPNCQVIVAVSGEMIVGMMALSRDETAGWVEQLYLHPKTVGQGIGTQLLEQAKTKLSSPIRLYTFQANEGARRFYERHGFQAIAFGDGTHNEEKCPDVLYEWSL